MTQKRYQDLTETLGKENFPRQIDNPMDFLSVAQEGIAIYAVQNFREAFEVSLGQVAAILDTSEPTLYRHLKANQKLSRNASIKLLEVTDLFLYGKEVFGTREDFFKWMELPNTALGGLKPMALTEVPEGVSKISDLLGRIEYGVYS